MCEDERVTGDAAELKIKDELVYDKVSGELRGFVEMGEINNIMRERTIIQMWFSW